MVKKFTEIPPRIRINPEIKVAIVLLRSPVTFKNNRSIKLRPVNKITQLNI